MVTTMVIKFPMKFDVEASSKAGSNTLWTAKAGALPEISSAIPPEFMGPGGGYSPEDLFGIALLNCLIATIKVYFEKSKVSFEDLKGKVTLTVDRVPGQSGFMLTHADIYVDIHKPTDPEKAKKLMETAVNDCAVSNSIKTGKTFHMNIS